MQSLSNVMDREVFRSFPEELKDVERLEFTSVDELEARENGHDDRGHLLSALEAAVARLEEEVRNQTEALPRKLDDARLLARTLARADWEQETQQRLAEDRAMIRRALEDFERERTRYFAAVEGQVVKLSLAIAARVLHREAKIDPLLLSAAVRVALEKVAEESETRLRVPVVEATLWKSEFESGALTNVKVIGHEGMARGQCVLETSVGTVELGIDAQLGEIERGFYDLMQKRPA